SLLTEIAASMKEGRKLQTCLMKLDPDFDTFVDEFSTKLENFSMSSQWINQNNRINLR
ncbi:11794_t:CDS:1, partial [Entrophospora sp. SA101]